MADLTIAVAGTAWPVPSSAANTDWAAQQVRFLQALAASINTRSPTFVTPSLLNSWVAKGSGFQAPRLYLNEWGQVSLEGGIKSGSGNTICTTLASAYRPPATIAFIVVCSAGWTTVTIEHTGDVTIGAASAGGDVGIFTSLQGCNWNVNS